MLKINSYFLFSLTILFFNNSTVLCNSYWDSIDIGLEKIPFSELLTCTDSNCFIKSNEETDEENKMNEVEKLRGEMLVYGFIREIELPKFNNKEQIISLDIIQLCVKLCEKPNLCIHMRIRWFYMFEHYDPKYFSIVEDCLKIYPIENIKANPRILHAACFNNSKMKDLLKKNGKKLQEKYRNKYYANALHWIVVNLRLEVNDHIKIAKLLLDNGADINLENMKGNTVLLLAWNNERDEKDKKMVKFLLKNGANIDSKKYGETLLHWSCKNGNKKDVMFLVKRGADINAKNFYKETALDLAKYNNRKSIVKYLESLQK